MYVCAHTHIRIYLYTCKLRTLTAQDQGEVLTSNCGYYRQLGLSCHGVGWGRAEDKFTPSTLFRDIVCHQSFNTYSVVVPVMRHFTPPNPHWNCDARVKSYQPNIL